MPSTSFAQTFERFDRLASAYVASPDIGTGIDLDEAANHLKRAAAQLPDPALTDLLHRFLRAIPPRDTAVLGALLAQIRERAAGHSAG